MATTVAIAVAEVVFTVTAKVAAVVIASLLRAHCLLGQIGRRKIRLRRAPHSESATRVCWRLRIEDEEHFKCCSLSLTVDRLHNSTRLH